jgi:two-component system chemotaxis response regulator CheB
MMAESRPVRDHRIVGSHAWALFDGFSRRRWEGDMGRRDIVVIGASAGGIEALRQVCAGLPHDLPAAVFVVLHIPADAPSILPAILERSGTLPAAHAAHAARFEPGHIYVAPPDHHLEIDAETMRLIRGPREHGLRPAVDPLFRTAAASCGARVIGIVLSGNLNDGTAGLKAIRQRGGMAIVQDPATTIYPSMPQSALRNIEADFVLPPPEIGPVLALLSRKEAFDARGVDAMREAIYGDEAIIQQDIADAETGLRNQNLSGMTCPDCGGALWELDNGSLIRYQCHVGHRYSGETLLAEQEQALEYALWSGVRALKEQAMLMRRLEEDARARGLNRAVAHYADRADISERHAQTIRDLIERSRYEVEVPEAEPQAPLGSE